MTKHYNAPEYSLIYPENWQLEEDADNSSVTVESPSGAFLTVTDCDDLDSAAEQALAAIADDYEIDESEEVRMQILGQGYAGQLQRFVYLDFLIVSQVFKIQTSRKSLLVHLQGEDRDMETLAPVFNAILTSLCQSLNSK